LLFTAGLLASQGHLNLWFLTIVASLGAVIGDSVGYAFGKRVGPRFCSREGAWFFTQHHLDRARHFYERHGRKTIVLARFLHVVRTWAPIIAGAANMHYGTFLLSNIVGGLFWTISVSALGYGLGNTLPDIDHYLLPILAVIGLLALSRPLCGCSLAVFSNGTHANSHESSWATTSFGAAVCALQRGDEP
jgi:membrane-associated protein